MTARRTLLVLWAGLLITGTSAQPVLDFPPSAGDRAAWMNEDKVGLFIVWGLYSGLGRGEWVMWNDKTPAEDYRTLASQFHPRNVDAGRWVRAAKRAGMKYVVITAKFHDGFALFETAASDFNVMDASPFQRDVIREVKEACDAEGLKLGLYYSHDQDWCNWGGTGSGRFVEGRNDTMEDFIHYMETIAIPQVKELCVQYEPELIWFDTPRKTPPELARKLTDTIRAVNPDILVSSRVLLEGNEAQDATREERDLLRETGVDFISYADREIPASSPWPYWETCMTLNNSWGYTEGDSNWKTPQRVIQQLIEVVSKGGTFLLSVGPDGDGTIDQQGLKVLETVGDWLKVNGEAVYGATPTSFIGPGGPTQDYRRKKALAEERSRTTGRNIHVPVEMAYDWLATGQEGKLFVSLFEWPEGNFQLEGMDAEVKRAYFLSAPGEVLDLQQENGQLTIELPGKAPGVLVPVLCIEIE